MTRSQQQGVLLVALSGVMILVYARALHRTHPVAAAAPSTSETTTAARIFPPSEHPEPAWTNTPALASTRTEQRQQSARLTWKRDPFTRGAAMGQMSGLTLAGILWDPQQPIAMINDRMVHVGEQLEGYTIVSISQDSVSVTDGTETFQLHVTP